MQIKHAPLGSTLSLGGDIDKRRLIFGEIKNGFAVLFKSAEDMKLGRWETMVNLSTRVKNVTDKD